MTETKTPDWFIEQVRSAHMWAVEKAHEGEKHPDNFIDALWIRFSRLENLAKIPEVKALIEAIDYQLNDSSYGDDTAVEKMNEALKPFWNKGIV